MRTRFGTVGLALAMLAALAARSSAVEAVVPWLDDAHVYVVDQETGEAFGVATGWVVGNGVRAGRGVYLDGALQPTWTGERHDVGDIVKARWPGFVFEDGQARPCDLSVTGECDACVGVFALFTVPPGTHRVQVCGWIPSTDPTIPPATACSRMLTVTH